MAKETRSTRYLNVRLTPSLDRDLSLIARSRNRKRSDIIRDLIERTALKIRTERDKAERMAVPMSPSRERAA
jgi:predicted transcriptional regulator